MSQSGFLYAFNLLGLDVDSYRIHYQFERSGVVDNSAPFPEFSGSLSSVGNFYSNSGSGNFSGQTLTIQNATGISGDFWTHMFILDRAVNNRGVIFDSLISGSIYSGYTIGINDNNRLYFESYDQNGPFSETSSLILGKKNLLAVTKANNIVSFYCNDFSNQVVLSENFTINGNFVLPSIKGLIGNAAGNNFADHSPLTGFIDEYIYLTEALNSTSLKVLFSGLCSDYQTISGAVSGYTTLEITGYSTGITGVTGVTGYGNTITGSGLDPFGTGNYRFFYGTTALTGYLTSGQLIVPITGNVQHYITGDPTFTIGFNSGLVNSFIMDEVSYIHSTEGTDISTLSILPINSKINKAGGFNLVQGQFQLDNFYDDSTIQIYLNGVAQIPTGYLVTGNFYGSGVVLSGDYRLNGFFVDSTGFFNNNDILIYDIISGAKNRVIVNNPTSGSLVSISGDHIFYNGILLIKNLDYNFIGGQFNWLTNQYSTTVGALSSFPLISGSFTQTGQQFSGINSLFRNCSQVYLNGQRQQINSDYLENSTIDLINQSGIFDSNTELLYNNDGDFFL